MARRIFLFSNISWERCKWERNCAYFVHQITLLDSKKLTIWSRERHTPIPKKLLQEQAHLQYEREHPEPHGEDVMVVDDGDSLGFIPHADSKVPKNLNRNISVAIPKYLVIEIESNIFDLPEVDRIKEARICKENGNKAFQGNNFDSALDHYFKGQSMVQEAYDFEIPSLRIEACNLLGEIILNICAILLKRNNASSVLQFTDEISKLFPNDENSYIMVKALFRRAQANAIREEYDAALQDLNHALTLESTNGALLSLRKRLLVKRKQQRSKEKTLYSAFFKKSSAFVDNEHYIAENLLKTLKSQEGHSGLPLNVVFNISEFLGFDIFNFALVCKDFHHVACELEDRWKLLCLRFKFYNASRDPDVYKWKNHCILVYKTVRWTFNLPNNLRRAAFPELAEVYRGSSEFFVDVCRRIADQMDKNKVYESEDAMIYSSLKELHRYWTLEKIYEFFGVQVEFGKPNTNEGTVELLNKNIEEYYHESAPEDRESAKYMFERSKTITTVDEAFDMMMESQWGLHGTIPTLMRCGFTYYNIQPKNLKMGFFCSDGLLALILEDQGFLHEGTIRKWMK
uniref:F-box domain-containing protein n=1 Tax=Percolomonas cosmopolitus TaxID=63605 RepID=A0A7S1PH00_9EUKA|mmetsp:Transcript_11034/g.41134  ORF Transcript_11034/g.41134 Transcript_11034/m.41134 type:complete len:571 (+) Transcript_11034:2349-4061(+)